VDNDPRRVVEELAAAVKANDAARCVAIYSEDCVIIDPLFDNVVGRDAALEAFSAWFDAFEVHDLEVVDTIVEGDRVAVVWRWSGLHKGDYLDVPASGKQLSSWNMILFDTRDGKVTRDLSTWDCGQLRALEQLAGVNR
jgi:steroid delta-isomerase-like uncharacterized protein